MLSSRNSILTVLHSSFSYTGGAELQAIRLGTALLKRGWRVKALALEGGPEPQVPFEVVRIRLSKIKGIAGIMLMGRVMWFLIRERGSYQVIHVHIMKTMALVSALVGKALGKKVVLKVSGYDELDHGSLNPKHARHPFYRFLNWGCRKADVIIAISRRTQSHLQACGYHNRQIVYLPNGIDVHRFRPSEDSTAAKNKLGINCPQMAIFVGRLVPEKGLPDLLAAWKLVRRRLPMAVLCLVGDGLQRSRLEQIVESTAELKGGVLFAGESQEVEKYLAAADCYAGASVSEGLSNTMLEAMAAGLPVICTNVSGAEDMVRNGENGFLVPVGDFEALAEKLVAVLSDLPRAKAMGRKARQLALELFDLDLVIERYEHLYTAS